MNHQISRRNHKIHRRLSAAFLSIVLALSVSLVSLTPRPVYAQWIVQDIASAASWVWEQIQTAAEWAWKHGGAVAYKNALRTYLTNIAYESAVMIGSGGTGQTPAFTWRRLGDVEKRARDAAAGDFIDSWARESNIIGLDVCRPSAPQVELIIGFSMFNEIKPRQPRCTWSEMQKNWQQLIRDPNVLHNIGFVLDPRQNDLGIALALQQNIVSKSTQEGASKATETAALGFINPIVEPITGFVKTPAKEIQALMDTRINLGLGEFGDFTGDVIADALGVFTNTLGARLMKRLSQGTVPSPSLIESGKWASSGGAGVEYAVQVNSSISTVQLVNSTGMVDIISEFVNCPSNPNFYTPINNCTITPKFAEALRKANQGTPLTVKEAIEQGFIDGNLRFALVRTTDDSRSPTKAWYLSDLKKLRLARIIPVGWELAAEKFAGRPITLRQVMEGFNSTGGNNTCDGDTGESPFCGLIDPNWVLRAPPAQCRIEAYGQLLEPRGPNRQTACVDFQHCIAEKADGTCEAWGYCKREQNIWRLSGKSCEFPEGSGVSPWGTCQSFTNKAGKTNNYLANSLTNYNDGVCSDAVSCRWYSAARNTNPDPEEKGADIYLPHKRNIGTQANVNTVDFTLATPNTPPIFYLKNVENRKCASNQEGCTRFIQLSNISTDILYGSDSPPPYVQQVKDVVDLVSDGSTYQEYGQLATPINVSLRQAPDYLNCYDANLENDAPECANYLKMCAENEVGCELYTPRDGSPAVPGKVEAANICPGECAGFNTYQQTSSFFENFSLRTPPNNVEPTFNFIPASGQKCSAAQVGCEEFTNIEQNERREYYIELRQCVRPEDNLANTYYTWVGSDLTGYQLKTWQLAALDVSDPLSPPLTTDGSGSCELNAITNPDCKEFYATSGSDVVVHLRYESKVIYSSSLCNRYRATNVIEADCATSGGVWEAGRCYYRAIPNQGKVCSAQAVGCREYRGPTAGNVRLVFPISTFGDVEPGVNADARPLSGWVGGINSNESTSATGHSLKITNVSNKDLTGLLTTGKQYMVSMWVKGETNSQIVVGITKGSEANLFTESPYPITTEWQIFNFGPIEFTLNDAGPINLTIASTALQIVYFDNIALREVQDTFFVRKNSWNTPSTCTPATLRCSAYTTRDRQTIHLTGFSKICRAEVVGCRVLIDTHNSISPQSMSVTAGDQTVKIPEDNVVYRVYDTKKSCSNQFVGCKRLGAPNYLPSGEISTWSDVFTVLNPDTFDPGVNLTASPLCSSVSNMCQAYTSPGGITNYFKDPGEKVCEYKIIDSSAGYNWYKKGTNQLCNLVKNPSFELLADGEVNDGNADTFVGWTSIPSTNPLEAVSSFNGQYWGSIVLRLPSATNVVRSDLITVAPAASRFLAIYARVRIPETVTSGNITLSLSCQGATCINFGGNFQLVINSNTPRNQWLLLHRVYEVRTSPNPSLGVQLQSSANNDIFVDQVEVVEILSGVNVQNYDENELRRIILEQAAITYAYECSSSEVGCTGYRDPELTNKTYWYLNNTALNKGLCAGQVSEKEGCLLFNEMSQPANNWSAVNTYVNSRDANNKLVAPVTATMPGKCSLNQAISCIKNADCGTDNGICYVADTNLVLKVQRDRVCAEWLACQSESPRFNSQTGKFDSVCYALGACNQLGTGNSAAGRCANWVQPPLLATPLNESKYKERGLDWSSQEYSGYSLPNIFPLEVLTQKEYGTSGNSDIRLTYLHPNEKTCGGFYDGESCNTIGDACTYKGKSYVCQYKDLGLTSNGPGDALENTSAKLCRAYPQADSPFPQGVVKEYTPACVNAPGAPGCPDPSSPYYIEKPKSMSLGFTDAYACQEGEVCDCSYSRLTYANGDNLFYSLQPAKTTSAYAIDVNTDGSPLLTRLRRQDTYIGLRGYCLEKDPSRLINAGSDLDRACLTWLPIDVVGGEMSVYDYSPEAGYQGGATFYCSEAKGYKDLGKTSSGRGSLTSVYKIQSHIYFEAGEGGGDCSGIVAKSTDNIFFCADRTYGWAIPSIPQGSVYSLPPNSLDRQIDERALIRFVDTEGNQKVSIKLQDVDWYGPYCRTDDNWASGYFSPWNGSVPGYSSSDYNFYVLEGQPPCDRGNSQVTKVILIFKKSDHKLDAILTFLMHGADEAGGVSYELYYYLTENCTEVVQSATAINNKAWTDRVLRRTDFYVPPATETNFTSSRITNPYGRMTLGSPPQGNSLVLVSDKPLGANPNNYQSTTTPFSCVGGTCGGNTPGMCIYPNSKIGTPCTQSSECNDGQNGICTGYFSGSCSTDPNKQCITNADCGSGGTCQNYRSMTNTPATTGRDRVREIFVAEYGVYNFGNSGWSSQGGLVDESNTLGSAPIVRAVDFGTGMIPIGEAEPNNFTVIYDGTARQVGSNVEIKTSEAITLAFYAYNANGEQMPLREVYVDWDDGSTMSGALGAYKNHKFRCAKPTLPNGEKNPEYNWGDSSSACVDDSGMQKGYFTYTHVYTNPGTYKPKIFVADNWEWCATGGWRCNPYGRGQNEFRSGLGWIKYSGTITVLPPPGGIGTYVAGPMTISPSSVVNSCGRQGGPFTPSGRTYTVINKGTATMSWTASSSQPWLTVTPNSGTIGPGGSRVVNVVLNSQVNNLSPGNYTATISFNNTTNNTPPGPVTRTFNLQVVNPTDTCNIIVNIED